MLAGSVVQVEAIPSPVSQGEIVAGKYRVERVLGVGAMGLVVSARHTTLDQVVAIKFLVASRFDTPEESIARFLAEARAAARIESDHVCRVFDVGTLPSGVPFMVMEHLEGRDLDEEIAARGPLPVVEAVDYVRQAADALAAAHQLGVVHRDIKPANLFLAVRPDGSRRVKVLDFGISKAHGEPHAPAAPGRAATSLGSPAYMSPEQVRAAADIDARADIWSLGAILYELVTAQMAFVGGDVRAVLDMVLQDDPCPMSALRADVPPELEAVVMRCLSRDRERRWPTAAALARALAPWGSVGSFGMLASVQRELGSLTSISGMRVAVTPASSVQPLVATIGQHPTQPDPEEVRARESIVEDWTKLRARKRTARTAVLALAAATLLAATGAMLLRMGASDASGASGASKAVAVAPAVDLPPPGESPLPAAAAAAAAASPASAAAPSIASASAAPTPVQSAPNSVQSARSSPPRASATARGPARPAPRGKVNHLLDSRD